MARRDSFSGLFWTQFCGAFNDNLFKTTVMVGLTFSSSGTAASGMWVNLAAGLFIAPFVLGSAFAGQLADKFEQSRLIRATKLLELAVMLLAAVALIFASNPLALTALALMGAQSALFGPAKYAAIPRLVEPSALTRANARVEMATFTAILGGTILAGALLELGPAGRLAVAITIVGVAALGYLASRRIPNLSANDPNLQLRFAPVGQLRSGLRPLRGNRELLLTSLGVSWFWFAGALVLAQLPGLVRESLGGDGTTLTVLLAIFAVGVGFGSWLCERLSGPRVDLGLVPYAALGMALPCIDLYFASHGFDPHVAWHWGPVPVRVAFDMASLGACGGLFVVPLQTRLQSDSPSESRARVIAANNLLNAAFMVAASGLAMAGLTLGLDVPELIVLLGAANLGCAALVLRWKPVASLRIGLRVVLCTLYRLRSTGTASVPPRGPAVLVCNHVSFLDALVIAVSINRPVRFVMDHRIHQWPLARHLFRLARTIPIAPARENPEVMQRAFATIGDSLDRGEVVCIFPEGRLTKDGEIGEFRPGIERILRRNPVPVVPMALRGLWGSVFSRHRQATAPRQPRRSWERVVLTCGTPLSPVPEMADELRRHVIGLHATQRVA